MFVGLVFWVWVFGLWGEVERGGEGGSIRPPLILWIRFVVAETAIRNLCEDFLWFEVEGRAF